MHPYSLIIFNKSSSLLFLLIEVYLTSRVVVPPQRRSLLLLLPLYEVYLINRVAVPPRRRSLLLLPPLLRGIYLINRVAVPPGAALSYYYPLLSQYI